MNSRDRPKDSVIHGLLQVAGYNLALVVVLAVTLAVPLVNFISATAIAFFSLTQLFYVLPLCRRLLKENRKETVKGVAIGAILTVFLNGGCFIWLILWLDELF